MAFESASGGFARGFQRGFSMTGNLLLQKRVLDQSKQSEVEKVSREATERRLKQSREAIKGLVDMASQVVEKGGNPEPFLSSAEKIAEALGASLTNLKLRAQIAGMDVTGAPDPSQVVNQLTLPVQAFRQAAGQLGPEATGTAEGVQEAAKTKALREAGVAKPNLGNFFIPSERKTVTIDMSDQKKLQEVLDQGGVQVSTSVEAASPGEAVGITKKEGEEFREAEIQTRTVVNELARMREQIQSGKTLTGLISTGTRAISGAAGNVLQASRVFGEDDSRLLDTAKYTFGRFGEAAAQSTAFQSNIVNLAYVMARASEPGGRLSGADVQMQIDRLAASSGDQQAILAAFDEVERQTKSAFKIRHQVLSRSADVGAFPEDLDPSGQTEEVPKGVPANSIKISEKEGKQFWQAPDGQIWVVE